MIRRSALVAIVVALLAGCSPDGAGRGDRGVVTETRWSWVCVRHDTGIQRCHKVGHTHASRCQAGERWPDCEK